MKNISDAIADVFVGRAVALQRYEAGLRAKVLRQLQALERDLVADLAKTDPTGPTYTAWQQARLEALQATVRETIAKHFRSMSEKHERAMKGLASVEAETTGNAVEQAVGADVLSVSITEAQIAQVATTTMIEGAPAADWWGRQSGDLHKKFGDAMRMGYLRGETVTQLAQRVRGTKAKGYSDGIMWATRRNAIALVRTSVQGVSNGARQAVYEANQDVVKGMQALATLDSRTTPVCIARDGCAWDLETKEPLPDSPRQEPWPGYPPWHWQCRTTIIPVLHSLKDALEAMGAKKAAAIADLPPSTRASMNGQVAATLDYESWLKKQPEVFQREVLGKGRWEMWQEGKLKLADLVDQQGRPYTIEELAKNYAAPKPPPKPPQAAPTPPPAQPAATPPAGRLPRHLGTHGAAHDGATTD